MTTWPHDERKVLDKWDSVPKAGFHMPYSVFSDLVGFITSSIAVGWNVTVHWWVLHVNGCIGRTSIPYLCFPVATVQTLAPKDITSANCQSLYEKSWQAWLFKHVACNQIYTIWKTISDTNAFTSGSSTCFCERSATSSWREAVPWIGVFLPVIKYPWLSLQRKTCYIVFFPVSLHTNGWS